jgi:hypothetical protein
VLLYITLFSLALGVMPGSAFTAEYNLFLAEEGIE